MIHPLPFYFYTVESDPNKKLVANGMLTNFTVFKSTIQQKDD